MHGAVENDAILAHQARLDADPDRIELYEELRVLYRNARARDELWCVEAALSYLYRDDRGKQTRLAHRRARGPIRARGCLDDERWLMDLRHPAQNLVVSKIFQTVWPAILSLRGKTDRDAGLAAKYQVDLDQHQGTLPRTLRFVAGVFGMQPPRLFLRTDVKGGLMHLPVYPLASLCGATLLQGFTVDELSFVAGRHLSDYRGEHYLRTLMPSVTELQTVLVASMRIAGLAPPDPRIDSVALEIRGKLPPAALDVLAMLCKRLVRDFAEVDVQHWLRSVELTACRAGLLVCNDLDVASRMLDRLGACGPVDLRPKEKMQDLVRFSVSEPYFRLRAALGIEGRVG
jgi:hypothetical protein